MSRRTLLNLILVALFASLPVLASVLDAPHLVGLATRFAIYGIAAASLDLVMGYGAMHSFGHAAFFGLGGYVVGVLAFHASMGLPLLGWTGTQAALLAWPLALACCGLLGLIVGYLSLRTSGVQFIMITLAFGQMVYYLLTSLPLYGGDDGMPLDQPNALPGVDLADPVQRYYLCAGLLLACLALWHRVVNSRFGYVLQGLRQSERRSVSLGVSALRYRLTAFTLSATGTGLAGILWANHALFISPDMASWHKSGELMAMVILGGVGTLVGPVLGAMAYLGLEELLGRWTEHWMLFFGPLLLVVVLFGRRGIHGLLTGPAPRRKVVAPHDAPRGAALKEVAP
ncbi:branched-chain amino acid ABC transporter permease [Verticiella sediminum]|uniref:Branched-chain amino acid ABC transporter permease n=1 Tax=Verticiella sediminum TaxID=1247510 RepID=A0A556AXL8_9BURK|nr:branched-chain amino acid ABC transporter permease [Verticiella sediminum]TSH97658.1 branched-chain amino acid ABC transporter permease [Verticiella sediminum]